MKNNEVEKKKEIKAEEYDLRIREISDSLKSNNMRILGRWRRRRTLGSPRFLLIT